jgi:[pyruvate, water dikinase]-phosphate phosphotransferase / [pyruvate, water dikinase] kinase
MHQILIISDGTGRTAEQALSAALTQFEGTQVKISVNAPIQTEEQVLEVIKEAASVKGFILHTVVSNKLRDTILQLGRLHNVETIDLMGPLLAQLSHHFSDSPMEKPGLFHELNKSYFQRIEAVEFTLRHDDGQRVEELNKAELVVLGVSRTFKTPISIYLAFKGWLVANIPIILGIDPPDLLNRIPADRVFCLTTYPNRLAVLRSVREKHLGGGSGNYAHFEYVRDELNYANRIFNRHPKWTKINVTNKPIEEIASDILTAVRKSK